MFEAKGFMAAFFLIQFYFAFIFMYKKDLKICSEFSFYVRSLTVYEKDLAPSFSKMHLFIPRNCQAQADPDSAESMLIPVRLSIAISKTDGVDFF